MKLKKIINLPATDQNNKLKDITVPHRAGEKVFVSDALMFANSKCVIKIKLQIKYRQILNDKGPTKTGGGKVISIYSIYCMQFVICYKHQKTPREFFSRKKELKRRCKESRTWF